MTDAEILELGRKRAIELGLPPKCLMGNYEDLKLYYAIDIHFLLGRGQEVAGNPNADTSDDEDEEIQSDAWGRQVKSNTHRALVIGVRPIYQESEERKLLRELLNAHKYFQSTGGSSQFDVVSAKARALLEEKE